MPRLAGLRHALVALALFSLPIGACSSKGGVDAGVDASVEATTPLPPPAGHAGDLFIASPGATWTKARAVLGGPAMFLPQTFGALATTLVGLPITMSAEIDEAVPVIGAAARQGHGPLRVVIGIHVRAGDRFVDQLTRGEGARFDAAVDPTSHVTTLTDKVAPKSRIAIGVLGNYLVVSLAAGDLHALAPYVVRTLAPATPPKEDIAIELSEASLAGPIADEARELRGRGERSGPTLLPFVGMLDSAATVLGDASHGRITLEFDAAAVRGRVSVTPKPGDGPGSKLVAGLATGGVKPLLDLPATTTLGLLWRESAEARRANAPKQAAALAQLLGSDVSASDKEAIASALGAEAEARGDWQAVGIAFNGTGPTAVVRAPVSDTDKMKKALKQLVDLGSVPAFKKALAGFGLHITSEKAVVENVAADVTRVRLARHEDDAKTKGKTEKAKPAAPAPGETPSAIDLLYFVDSSGLSAAAGFDPKDSLRALVKAPSGSNLASNAPMASALASVGEDAVFVLIADALRIAAMTTGAAPPASPTPLVIAAGKTAAPSELWARFDLPSAVLQQLVEEYTRRKGSAL